MFIVFWHNYYQTICHFNLYDNLAVATDKRGFNYWQSFCIYLQSKIILNCMTINRKRIKIAAISLTVLYLATITLLSLMKIESDINELELPNIDKIIHFCFYFGLNFLLLITIFIHFGRINKKHFLIATCCSIFYSALIELTQTVVGRHCDMLDFVANSLGAICAIFVVRFFLNRIRCKS